MEGECWQRTHVGKEIMLSPERPMLGDLVPRAGPNVYGEGNPFILTNVLPCLKTGTVQFGGSMPRPVDRARSLVPQPHLSAAEGQLGLPRR